VWQSHSHATAVKTDALYPTFLQKRQALATDPVSDYCISFSGNPQRCFEAPITEIVIYRTDELTAAETQEKTRLITARVESLQIQGFIALSWGVAAEDKASGVYIAGWRTIEVSNTNPPPFFFFFPNANQRKPTPFLRNSFLCFCDSVGAYACGNPRHSRGVCE
jgi:hypothetical protein